MGLTRPRWCWSGGEKGPGRRHLYKAAPWHLVRGVLGLFGDSWSPNFASDRLLKLFGLDSSALFNFSQADHACFKSFRNSFINSTMEHLLCACWSYEGTKRTEITALVEFTLYWSRQKANETKCEIYNMLAGNKYQEENSTG